MAISEYIVPFTDEAIEALYNSTPTKIVRCKDCAHSAPATIDGQRKCELLPMVFFEDDFCSMGVKKKE